MLWTWCEGKQVCEIGGVAITIKGLRSSPVCLELAKTALSPWMMATRRRSRQNSGITESGGPSYLLSPFEFVTVPLWQSIAVAVVTSGVVVHHSANVAFHEYEALLDSCKLQSVLDGHLEQVVQPCNCLAGNLALALNLIFSPIMPVTSETSLQLLG